MEQVSLRLVFYGQVQGVGFRFTAKRIAEKSAVTGYVRNVDDGSVELNICGLEQDVRRTIADIVARFRNNITRMEEAPSTGDSSMHGFTIHR